MIDVTWQICIFFLAIAFVYSSVGFGGGSSYLALLAVYGLPYQELRLIALLCNVIVVTGGVYVYVRNKQLNWKKTIPLVIASVPMAYLGAIVKISQATFFVLLGCSLIIAAVLLWIEKVALSVKQEAGNNGVRMVKDATLGGAIGFLSGMVGIGGGIFLSPMLNLMRWEHAKKIAATASVFILVNSISGIAGQLSVSPEDLNVRQLIMFSVAVLIGGQLGSRIAIKWNTVVIRRVTAVLVFAAGANVLIKNLPTLF